MNKSAQNKKKKKQAELAQLKKVEEMLLKLQKLGLQRRSSELVSPSERKRVSIHNTYTLKILPNFTHFTSFPTEP